MQRNLLATLILTLGFVGTQSPALAVVTPGKVCYTVKKTLMENNLKFTCIKVGKKLVWNKGVPVRKTPQTLATPKPLVAPKPAATRSAITIIDNNTPLRIATPTPVATPTPTPVATPTPTPVATPTPTPVATPTPTPVATPTLGPGLVPAITLISSDNPTKTVIGQVSNYDATYRWTFGNIPTGASASIDSSGLLRIYYPADCGNNYIYVFTGKDGQEGRSKAFGFEMNCVKLPTPTFGRVSSKLGSFTVPVTNFDSANTYSLSIQTNQSARATIDSSGLITVGDGLGSNGGATVFVTVQRNGYASSSGQVSGAASPVQAGFSIQLGTPISNSTGFIVPITNFTTQYSWHAAPEPYEFYRSVRVDLVLGQVEVGNLRPGESLTIEVDAILGGNLVSSAIISGSASPARP
jgi:hypothetical protein